MTSRWQLNKNLFSKWWFGKVENLHEEKDNYNPSNIFHPRDCSKKLSRDSQNWRISADIPDVALKTCTDISPGTLSVFLEAQFPSIFTPPQFPPASLPENCSLLETDDVRGKILMHIFAPWGDNCFLILQRRTDKETEKDWTDDKLPKENEITDNLIQIRVLNTWSRHKLCHHVHSSTHPSTPSCKECLWLMNKENSSLLFTFKSLWANSH